MNSNEPEKEQGTLKEHLKAFFFVSITFIVIGVLIYFEMK